MIAAEIEENSIPFTVQNRQYEKILEENGYVRVCSDVKLDGLQFEDWYCNPKLVDMERIKPIETTDREWQDVIFVEN